MKREGLKDLLGDLEPHKPEKKLKITRDKASDDLFSKITKCYEKALTHDFSFAFEPFSGTLRILRLGVPDARVPDARIMPQIISEFSVMCNTYSDFKNYQTATGIYLTALIKKSYRQGNNNFVIETNGAVVGESLIGLCANLIGKKENPIKVLVHGDLGMYAGICAENIAVTVRGNAGAIAAQRAKNSEFVIDDLLVGCGAFSENCVFKSKSKEVLADIKKTKAITNATLYWINKKGKDVLYARVTSKL